MTEYKFEEFKAKGERFKPVISVTKNSGFNLSSGFIKVNGLENISGVKLYYDKEHSAIAFKFLKTDEDGMLKFPLRKDKSVYLSARSFLGKNNIHVSNVVGRYAPIEIMDENYGRLFVIELKSYDN